MRNIDQNDYEYGGYEEQAGAAGGGFLTGALTGAALASALVYLLDPQSGPQRRTMVRNKASTAFERSRQGIGSARTRAQSLASQGRERFEQARSKTSRYGSRAGTQQQQGAYEGARSGAYDSSGTRPEFGEGGLGEMLGGQGSRLATGAAGLGLAGWGLSRRGPLGLALGALGLYLVATSARQKGSASFGPGIEIENSVTIDKPVQDVWQVVQRVEGWPQFMSHVQEITASGDRRYHWRVDGPAGVPAEWDAEVTEQVPNERISWRSLPGAMVDSEGSLELQNDGSGGTRVTLHMIYSPPAGAAGHVVAKLFRRDPQTQSQHDLQNLKEAVESGRAATMAGSGGLGAQGGSSSPLGGGYTPTH